MKKSFTILLINPWIYDFAAYDFFLKPLGLLYIASVLKNNGINTILLDLVNRYNDYFVKNKLTFDKKYGTGKIYYEIIEKPEILKNVPRNYKRYGLPYKITEKCLNEISKEKIDAILITSMMTYWYPGVKDIISLVKKFFPSTPVILGGMYVTLLPVHAKKVCNPDYIVPGKNLQAVIQKISEILQINLNLQNNFVEPAYELYKKLTYLPILTSIGCPFKCAYCSTPLLNPQFSFFNPIKVYEVIEKYTEKFKIKDIAFYDDALLFKFNENLKIILELVIKNRKKLRFHTPNGMHARFITPEVAEYLFEAGFKTIRISLETINKEWLKRTGNKVNLTYFEQAIKNLEKAGYKRNEIEVYLLAGVPDQTEEELELSVKYLIENGLIPRISEFSPVPGTYYYKKYRFDLLDPLLHNNSVFYRFYSKITAEKLNYLRHLHNRFIKAQ